MDGQTLDTMLRRADAQ